jgi:hypothetical protein
MERLSSFLAFILASFIILSPTPGCGGNSPTPAQVASAIINCTETTCTTAPTSTSCTQLEGAIMGCLTSGGNVAICLAGIPALVSVGYADVACIVAALATPAEGSKYKALATTEIQKKAADWLASQRIVVNQR